VTKVWTDGSYNAGGHKVGGWAALIEQDGTPQVRIAGAEKDTNHQRMELTAVIKALEQVSGAIEMRLDSRYVQRCFIEEWHVRWRRDGRWRGLPSLARA
jgi:ribonuclease HI